jgi:hypothetical protein
MTEKNLVRLIHGLQAVVSMLDPRDRSVDLDQRIRSKVMHDRTWTGVPMPLEPEPDEPTQRRPHSKRYESVAGLVYVLGTVGVIVVIIYVLGSLD